MTRYAFSLILFCGLLISCEYQTDKVYFRELDNNPEAPVITNHLLDLETDTIHIFIGKTELSFDFRSSNQEISLIKVLLNNKPWLQMEDPSKSFTLEYSDLDEDQNTLTLELFTQTGTGSIAEKTGYEAFFFKREYALIKHGSLNEMVTSSVNRGLLNLKWTNYPVNSMDFDSYILYRTVNGSIKLSETTTPHYTDSSYVGEKTDYWVKVRKKNGMEISWGAEHLNQDFPQLSFQTINDSTQQVFWTKPTFYGAIKGFQLEYRMPDEYEDSEKFMEKTDTFLNIPNLFFGDACPITFHVIPENKNLQQEKSPGNFLQKFLLKVGTKLPNVDNQVRENDVWAKVGRKEIIFRSYQNELWRYDVEKLEFTQIFKPDFDQSILSMVFSEGGNFATNHFLSEELYILINTKDFSTYVSRNLNKITGYRNYPSIIPSDDGLVLVPRNGDGFVIYDMWMDRTVASAPFPDGLKLSHQANYLWVRDDVLKLVKRTGSTYKTLFQAKSKYYEDCWFHTADTNMVVIQAENSINVYTLNPFSLKQKLELGSAKIVDFDFHNNEVLLFNHGWLKVINFLNNKELYKVHVPHSYFSFWAMYSSKTMLIDHKIIRKPNEMYDLTLSE